VVQEDGILSFQGCVCVQDCKELKEKIMNEVRNTPYSIHLGGNKIYKDLHRNSWCNNMKKEVADYASRYLSCQNLSLDIAALLGNCSNSMFPPRNGIPSLWILWWGC